MKLLSEHGGVGFPEKIPEELFNCLIPSKDVINDENLKRQLLVAYPYVDTEREERVKKLVEAGAEITSQVINEGINHGMKDLVLLLRLGGKPQVDHLKNCLEIRNHDGILLLKEVLPKIHDRHEVVKREFPDIVLQTMRYMRYRNLQSSFDRNFITLLLEEYGIDVNYSTSEDCSLLHWLSYFRQNEANRVAFLLDLINKYEQLDLDILSKRDWDNLDQKVTPLQIAIENKNFEIARVLVGHFASTDKFFLNGIKLKDILEENDASLHALLVMLDFIGFKSPFLDLILIQLKTRYINFEKLHERPPLPSLQELSCQAIRRGCLPEQVKSLIREYELPERVKDFLFLKHIQPLEFPKRVAIFGEDSDDDDEFDDDDDDDIDDFDDGDMFYDSDHHYGYEYDSDSELFFG